MKFCYWILSKIDNNKKKCQECADFIQRGSKILDLGCGSGMVAKAFQDFFQAEIIGVDIQDSRIINIPFKIIDNKKNLPFSDNEFDVALLFYVLHHSKDPKRLLEEAKRVSKKIIIYEDIEESKWDKFIYKIHLATFNLFFQSQDPVGYSFKTEKEWEETFRKMGMKIIFKKRLIHDPISRLKLVKRTLFILEKIE